MMTFFIPDTLDADDINDDVINKYLNAELIFDLGTVSECRGRVVKSARGTSGKQMVARILTPYLILEDTSVNLPTELPRTILPM
jgi:hypothetical protein